MAENLCHYTGVANIENIIQDKGIVLYASRFTQLNDKLEYSWAKKLMNPMVRDLCERYGLTYDKDMDGFPFVLCFSREIDSFLLWQLYAQDGRGYCLVFDRNEIIKRAEYDDEGKNYKDNPDVLMDIRYADDNNFEEKFIDAADEYMERLSGGTSDDLLDVCAIIKRNIFGYEAETRYLRMNYNVVYLSNNSFSEYEKPNSIKFRINKDGIIPFYEVDFPKCCLKKIIIGYELDFEKQKQALELLLHQRGYGDVEILESKKRP